MKHKINEEERALLSTAKKQTMVDEKAEVRENFEIFHDDVELPKNIFDVLRN